MDFQRGYLKELIDKNKYSYLKLKEEMEKRGNKIALQTIKSWFQGGSTVVPEFKNLIALGDIFKIDPIYLMSEIPLATPNIVSLPIFEAVAGCGAEGYLEDLKYAPEKINFDVNIFSDSIITKELAVIRIVGDSMEPYLEQNDLAIIQMRNGRNVEFIDGVYLIAHGQNVQIKRCQFQYDGSCLLISDNKEYREITAIAGEWDVIGKVYARFKGGSPFIIKE